MSTYAPSLFISHGTGPFPLLDPDQESYREMLRGSGHKLDGVKGIILISAHWETDEPHITAINNPGLFYDYEQMRDVLPEAAFAFQYPANGDSKLAADIAEHLKEFGFRPVLDYKRGFDHAVYVPMTLLRPDADIPIVQMSVLQGRDEKESTDMNIRLGQALECYRSKGYAIMGSGGSFHDFDTIAAAFFKKKHVPASASQFEKFLESVAVISDPTDREATLRGWRDRPESYIAHPVGKSEHLLPFMVVAGSGGNKPGTKFGIYNFRGVPMSCFSW